MLTLEEEMVAFCTPVGWKSEEPCWGAAFLLVEGEG